MNNEDHRDSDDRAALDWLIADLRLVEAWDLLDDDKTPRLNELPRLSRFAVRHGFAGP